MFKDILGQDQALTTLTGALLADRLAGTYLFVGPEHVGKTSTAIELARALNCTGRQIGVADSCGVCPACRAIDKGTFPDLRTVAPVGPSRIMRMPQIWPRDGVKEHPPDQALLRDLHYRPLMGKKRVFVLEDANSLNVDTANSMLKVLEEPPDYALFVLSAPSTQSLLPTIVSRSQVVRFGLAGDAVVEEALSRRFELPQSTIRLLAAAAQGQIGVALLMAQRPAVLEGVKRVLDIAQDLTSSSELVLAFKLAEDLRKQSSTLTIDPSDAESSQRVAVVRGMDVIIMWHGDLLRYAISGSSARLISEDRRKSIATAVAHLGAAGVERSIRLLTDSRHYIERNANAQVTLDALFLRLMALRLGTCA